MKKTKRTWNIVFEYKSYVYFDKYLNSDHELICLKKPYGETCDVENFPTLRELNHLASIWDYEKQSYSKSEAHKLEFLNISLIDVLNHEKHQAGIYDEFNTGLLENIPDMPYQIEYHILFTETNQFLETKQIITSPVTMATIDPNGTISFITKSGSKYTVPIKDSGECMIISQNGEVSKI
jgi:hypothetical protein